MEIWPDYDMSNLCPVCKVNPLGRNKNCCSQACYSIYKSHFKTCVICGTSFQDSASNDTATCGEECSAENRRRKPELIESLAKAHTIAKNHPLTGRFETHVNAKEWVIISPNGVEYKCRNLMLWLRDHDDLLDGTPKQAFDGFSKMKQTAMGKRTKQRVFQWKGWRLKEWGE